MKRYSTIRGTAALLAVVLLICGMLPISYADKAKPFYEWENVCKCISGAGNESLTALKTDGTMLFYEANGNPSNPLYSELAGWRNVVDFVVVGEPAYATYNSESTVAALTRDGTVLVTSGFAEYAGINLSEWTGIKFICSGCNVLGAIRYDGTVLLAGGNENTLLPELPAGDMAKQLIIDDFGRVYVLTERGRILTPYPEDAENSWTGINEYWNLRFWGGTFGFGQRPDGLALLSVCDNYYGRWRSTTKELQSWNGIKDMTCLVEEGVIKCLFNDGSVRSVYCESVDCDFCPPEEYVYYQDFSEAGHVSRIFNGAYGSGETICVREDGTIADSVIIGTGYCIYRIFNYDDPRRNGYEESWGSTDLYRAVISHEMPNPSYRAKEIFPLSYDYIPGLYALTQGGQIVPLTTSIMVKPLV